MTESRWTRLALVAILLAAFALRVYRLDAQDIWWDEARNIDVAGRAMTQIASAPELDIHPPVYFYALHVWGALAGRSAFAMRYLSLWFGALLVALMYALGRWLGGRWVGLGAAVGAAALPFLLGEAQETRMYTLLLVWLVAAGVALWHGQRRGQARAWLAFALFSALALLTHYAAVFALVPLWGWAALWVGLGTGLSDRAGRPFPVQRRLRTLAWAGAVTVLLCLPGLPVALRQIPAYRNANLVVPAVGAYLAELARVYGLGEHLDVTGAWPWAWALAILLLSGWALAARPWPRHSTHGKAGALGVSAQAHRRQVGAFTLALVWAVLPLAIYYVVIADRGTFATRYIAGALPGWLLLAGWAVKGWARLNRWAGIVVGAALAAVFVPGLRGDLTDVRFFRDDTRGVVAWLNQMTDPARDLILVDQRYPFGYYYARWNNAAAGIPPAEPATQTPAQYLFVDLNMLDARLRQLAVGRQRIFWVRWFESDTDPRGATDFLLTKFGALEGERAFRGYAVRWYAIAPDAPFEIAPSLTRTEVAFADQVRLSGFAFGGRGTGSFSTPAETHGASTPADGGVWVAARWAPLPGATATGQFPRGLKVSVALEDAGGGVVGRDDRPLVNDRHLAPAAWASQDAPLGVYWVKPQPGVPPGTYIVRMGVYDPVTLAPLGATGRGAAGSWVTLGQVTLTRARQAPAVADLGLAASSAWAWSGMRLLGRGPLPATIGPGDRISVELFWQAEGDGMSPLRLHPALIPADGGARLALQETGIALGYDPSYWVPGEIVRDRQTWRVDPGTPAGTYRLVIQLGGTGGALSPNAAHLGEIVVAGRSHTFTPPMSFAHPVAATVGDFARLLGCDATKSGNGLTLTVVWQALGASAQPLTASAQLLNAAGVLVAQRDQPPGAGQFPTTGWVAGEFLTDRYEIALPGDLPPGDYRLSIKLYDPQTGQTQPVVGEAGAPPSDFAELTTISLP